MLYNILFLLLNDKSPDFVDSDFSWVTVTLVILFFVGAELSNKIFNDKSHKE